MPGIRIDVDGCVIQTRGISKPDQVLLSPSLSIQNRVQRPHHHQQGDGMECCRYNLRHQLQYVQSHGEERAKDIGQQVYEISSGE